MEELFNKLEHTVEELIYNVQILGRIAFDEQYADESQEIYKKQEVLLNNLVSIDHQIEELGLKNQEHPRSKLIEAKLNHFGHLNHMLINKTYTTYANKKK